MHTRYWKIIKDDSKRTFEVCGMDSNTDSFANKTIAMQRAGLNVSCVLPPVTNRTASKEVVTVFGYTRENGLYERLSTEFRAKIREGMDDVDLNE